MTPETIKLLQAKLDLKHVSKREGAGGKMLDYLETWFVIAEANRIFGHDGWSSETVRLECIGSNPFQDKYGKEKFAAAYRSTVKITVGSIVREGSGFGDGMDTSELKAHELALKESESDSLKRAFMKFGYPFGLALYDKTRANVDDGRTPASPETTIEQKEAARVKSACTIWLDRLSKANLSADDIIKKFTEFKNAVNAKGESMWNLANNVYPEIGTWLFEEVDKLTKGAE